MRLYIKKGRVQKPGWDMGGYGKVIAENKNYIVVKWPSHMYWSGRGQQSYASPQTEVFKIVDIIYKLTEEYEYTVEELIEWENKRKRKGE